MFTRSILMLAVAYLATGMAWAAGSPFIGQWKLDASRSRLPDEMKVESKGGGSYVFDFGAGPETIVVDGSGQPGYDGTLLSVKPTAPDQWIVERKKDGRLLLRATWKLSPDGSTLTDAFRGVQPDGSAFSVDYVYRRAAAGSGFAADWKSISETMNSPFSIEVKPLGDGGLSIVTPSQHATRDLRLDGKDYPTPGAPASAGASSSSWRINERHLLVTDKAGGKVSDTRDVALSTDLRILTMTVRQPGRGRPTVLVFTRN